MAKGWKNFKEKIDAGSPKAGAGDWLAMQEKINATPELNSTSPKLRFLWLLYALVPLAALIVFGYFMQDRSGENPSELQQNISDQSLESLSQFDSTEQLDNSKSDGLYQLSDSEAVPKSEGTNLLEERKIAEDPNQALLHKAKVSGSLSQKPAFSLPLKSLVSKTQSSDDPLALGAEVSQPEPVILNDNEQKHSTTREGQSNLVDSSDFFTHSFNTDSLPLPSEQSLNDSQPDLVTNAEPADGQGTLADLPSVLASHQEADKPAADFVRSELGFKFTRAEAFLMELASIENDDLGAYGFGIQGTWQKNGFLLRTGLTAGQAIFRLSENNQSQFTRIDSTVQIETQTREELRISRQWVIDSIYFGRWVIDSNLVSVTDTVARTIYDTTLLSTMSSTTKRYRLSFAEMPITAGYQWQGGAWLMEFSGGVILNQVTSTASFEGAVQNNFGLDALLQPAVGLSLNDRWTIYCRVNLRYPLIENQWLSRSGFRYGFQVGMAYQLK